MSETPVSAEKTPSKIAKSVTYSDISLNETSSLIVKRTISTYRITRLTERFYHYSSYIKRDLLGSKSKILVFPLVPTNREELLKYRRLKIPSIILKKDGVLYYGRIPNNLTFPEVEFIGEHLCAKPAHECTRLSAASNEYGGCAKVRNRSRGIEYYRWITDGFETFGTQKDAFIVINCQHYSSTIKQKVRL